MRLSPEQRQLLETIPNIKDPKDFLLARKIGSYGRLETAPNLDLLRFLTTVPYEAALVYHQPLWFMVVGRNKSVQVPNNIPFDELDIWLHSHPESEINFLPSPDDIHRCPDYSRNFIVSNKGVTQYYPFLTPTGERDFYAGLDLMKWFNMERYLREGLSAQEVVDAYSDAKTQYTMHPFEEITDRTLQDLFYEKL